MGRTQNREAIVKEERAITPYDGVRFVEIVAQHKIRDQR
jgi:hypothetical protein